MRRAFSLIELLLAVFILGIGIISISAIFPAGILQQQLAADEQMGPVVADHALNVIRSKVRPDDFGSFEQLGVYDLCTQSAGGAWRPAPGDWTWIRPAVLTSNVGTNGVDETGAVDIFANWAFYNSGAGTISLEEFTAGLHPTAGGPVVTYGVPYNASRYSGPPPVLVTQKERYWPMAMDGQNQRDPAQYAWDCMFRKFGGKVQVAIFVYRVLAPGGAARNYVASALPSGGDGCPPVPYRGMTGADGQFTAGQAIVPPEWQQTSPPAIGAGIQPPGPYSNGVMGTPPVGTGDTPSSSNTPYHHWQLPGQWLLDNNGSVIRVATGRRIAAADPARVQFGSPVPRVPQAQVFADYENPNAVLGIRALWFVPALDAAGNQLVPVYVTVRNL